LCPRHSALNRWAILFRPLGFAGPAVKISAGFWFFVSTGGRREPSSYKSAAAGESGRNDSRGQGLRGSDMTSEAPISVRQRAAMTSPQRHRDRRDNPQFIAGDGLAPTPCLRGEDSCQTRRPRQTNPIRRARRRPHGLRRSARFFFAVLGRTGSGWSRVRPLDL
jgi:hypothetical protein